jgi:hypothetical protein
MYRATVNADDPDKMDVQVTISRGSLAKLAEFLAISQDRLSAEEKVLFDKTASAHEVSED